MENFIFCTGNVNQYEFATGKNVLPEKELLEKAAKIRFEYVPLSTKLKAQTGIAKNQYKAFQDQMNIKNNNGEKNENDKAMSDEDKSDKSKTIKRFDTIMEGLLNQ